MPQLFLSKPDNSVSVPTSSTAMDRFPITLGTKTRFLEAKSQATVAAV